MKLQPIDEQASEEVNVDFPPKMLALFIGAARYRIAYGGRGSGKSWSFARELILRSMEQYDYRVLCCRELQKSMKDSVHYLLKSQIYKMGLEKWFTITDTSIKNAWGAEFLFYGLRTNADQIKSMEDIDVAWVEEAHGVTDASWELLIPTIRKPGSEIWVSMNPDQETDPSYQRFIVNTPRTAKIVQINFCDNPWFAEPLVSEMEELRETDPDAYQHVWLGSPRARTANQLINVEWIVHALHNRFVDDGSIPRIKISVDVSDGGKDKSVVTVARIHEGGTVILRQTAHRWPSSVAVTMCAEYVEQVWNNWGCSADNGDVIVVDSLGVGAGVAGNLMKEGLPVIPYKGGEGSANPDLYRNMRVQTHIALRNAFRDGTIYFEPEAIADEKERTELKIHLTAIKRVAGQEKREDIETKDQLKSREGFSPDRSDSLAMLFADKCPTIYTDDDWSVIAIDGLAA